MTYRERICDILKQDIDMDKDSVEKLVYIAYMMGREKADREVSDLYNSHLAEQRKRAAACRYNHMAEKVIGAETYLYTPVDVRKVSGSNPLMSTSSNPVRNDGIFFVLR